MVWGSRAYDAFAEEVVREADLLLVVGTSLSVYPAAGLVYAAPQGTPLVLIDPGEPDLDMGLNYYHIKKPATEGMTQLIELLTGPDQV